MSPITLSKLLVLTFQLNAPLFLQIEWYIAFSIYE